MGVPKATRPCRGRSLIPSRAMLSGLAMRTSVFPERRPAEASARRTCGVSRTVEAWPAQRRGELNAGRCVRQSKIAVTRVTRVVVGSRSLSARFHQPADAGPFAGRCSVAGRPGLSWAVHRSCRLRCRRVLPGERRCTRATSGGGDRQANVWREPHGGSVASTATGRTRCGSMITAKQNRRTTSHARGGWESFALGTVSPAS